MRLRNIYVLILMSSLSVMAAKPQDHSVRRDTSSIQDILNNIKEQIRDTSLFESVVSDITGYIQDTTESVEARNRRFYENLEHKSQNSGFAKWLHGMLIVNPREPVEDVVDESGMYAPYNGKPIVSIDIDNRPIFDRARSHLQKGMESVHSTTWKYTVRKDLLFKVGDKVDADVVIKTKQLLKSRAYLYDAQIFMEPYESDTSAVVVKVVTRDKWTLVADGGISGLTGRISGDIIEHNLGGSGNRLSYRLSLDWKNGSYEGSLFQYHIPNMFKAFYEADFAAGRSFWRKRYTASVNKKLLLNSDYELGVKGGLWHDRVLDIARDSFVVYGTKELDVWAGRSFYLKPANSSIYGMLRYHGLDFVDRPYAVGPGLNTAFHDRRMLLGSLGLYRENFLAANLIYGYGFKEYIATGYRVELFGGYAWEEFGRGWYTGVSARAGGFTPIGYFMGDIRAGGFMGYEGMDFYRSAIDLNLTYFTNLIDVGPYSKFRQFIGVDVLRGWNRGEGIGEYVRFTKESGPRYFLDKSMGRNRLVLSSESVLFTPWNPVGFRVALFAFGDVGWIGNRANFFRNDIYSTVGLGIRLKNERLIFSTIELSFNFAFGKNGFMRTEPVRLGSEKRVNTPRFTPDKPMIVEYY